MRIQEVICRAISGQIHWFQAAEILGVSVRTMSRWKEYYQKKGYDGLFDRRRRRPSPKRVPYAQVEAVLRLFRERYSDFNVKHFHEKLTESHGITLSYTWVKTALQEAGLIARRARRGPHRTRRPRRPGDAAASGWQYASVADLVSGSTGRSVGPHGRRHEPGL